MDTVTLVGNLTAGPQGVCESGLPSGILQLQFGLGGTCPSSGSKQASKKIWSNVEVNSPSTFATLNGVGAGESVTQATTLFIRTKSAMEMRITSVNPSGGADLVASLVVKGLLILEPSEAGYVKLVEAKGAGSVEYFASGNL